MKLLSWNVNGIRAVLKRNFLKWFRDSNPDILCLQETKAHPDQVSDVEWPKDYHAFWNPAEKKGYSGTVIFTKEKPHNVTNGMGDPEHDGEGRLITAEFSDFYLVNVYTPNSQRGLHRLSYRVGSWDLAFRKYLAKLKKKKPVIFCGDLNVAHREIDIARPKANERSAGFTIEERTTFDDLLKTGFLDSFREFESGPGHYSWWSYMGNARAKNVGWRIDYFCMSKALQSRLKNAFIRPEIMGSDHCPVGIELT